MLFSACYAIMLSYVITENVTYSHISGLRAFHRITLSCVITDRVTYMHTPGRPACILYDVELCDHGYTNVYAHAW